jgi:hypothetical protein
VDAVSRNAGIVWLNHEDIAQLIDLPEGQVVRTVAADWQRMAVGVVIEGEGLPDCAEGSYPETVPTGPYVDLTLRQKIRALLDRYDEARDGDGADDMAAMLEMVLTRELDPRIDMPEDLKAVIG